MVESSKRQRRFPGNLVSSSDGLKVVGISGMVASDIDDLVVATVIPGLGKDMADVQVRISAHLSLLILSFCHFENWGAMICRLTTTAWTLRGFPFAKTIFSLGMSAVSLEEAESDQLSWAYGQSLWYTQSKSFICNPVRPMVTFYQIYIGNILHLLF